MVLRALDVPANMPPEVSEDQERIAPPPPGTVRWIDLCQQTEPVMGMLAERFTLHPLTVEDCLHVDQRPKLEEYGDYLFIVLHAFDAASASLVNIEPCELHVFLGMGWLITIHEKPIAALQSVFQRVAGDVALGRRGADFLFYLVADAIVDGNFLLIDKADERIEEIEASVLTRHRQADLAGIFELKRVLVAMRRVLSPERDVFALLAKRGDCRIAERTALYFRDVYDHLARIHESIDAGRDLLGNALDAYLSMESNRTNEIMKRLTLLSAVFLPLTFITGFFGQNFEHMPFKSDGLLFSMIAACLFIPSGMLYWFRRSGWF